MGVTMESLAVNIFAFVAVKTFPILNEIIELHENCVIFAISCMVGCLFIVLIVPETKGKDLNVRGRKISIDSAILQTFFVFHYYYINNVYYYILNVYNLSKNKT